MCVPPMKAAELDEMIELALEGLLSGDDARRRGLVRAMVMRWPEAPALQIVFALTSAGAAVEDTFGSGADGAQALAYKLAALLAADVHALQEMGRCPAKARDLLHFWRRVDPYFLTL